MSKRKTESIERFEDPWWLWAFRSKKAGSYPDHAERGGKWLIFVSENNAEVVWKKISDATIRGLLGSTAKMSTSAASAGKSGRVICVYTYDYEDSADVNRVRAALRELGVTGKIPYKADADTIAGRYAGKGVGNIGKRFE